MEYLPEFPYQVPAAYTATEELGREDWVVNHAGVIIHNTHKAGTCVGSTCTLHKPTAHHMRYWELDWWSFPGYDSMLARICPHGKRHPDPDGWFANMGEYVEHECDACCIPEHEQEKIV